MTVKLCKQGISQDITRHVLSLLPQCYLLGMTELIPSCTVIKVTESSFYAAIITFLASVYILLNLNSEARKERALSAGGRNEKHATQKR